MNEEDFLYKKYERMNQAINNDLLTDVGIFLYLLTQANSTNDRMG